LHFSILRDDSQCHRANQWSQATLSAAGRKPTVVRETEVRANTLRGDNLLGIVISLAGR